MHTRLTLLCTVSLCLGNKPTNFRRPGLLYTCRLHLPHVHSKVCASRMRWTHCTCADQLKTKLNISWAYWTHVVPDVHSKSRASGRGQSVYAESSVNVCSAYLLGCWKLTSSFPTWKALEVTATPEPGNQEKKKKKEK